MSGKRPTETTADVIKIVSECYGLQVLKVTELVSYDCRNFAVEVTIVLPSDEGFSNKTSKSRGGLEQFKERAMSDESSLKFVLKIFNKWLCSAERLPQTRQQILCSQFLRQRGFLCPEIVKTNKGKLFGNTSAECCTLLMRMLPGQQLGADHSRITVQVLYEMGVLLACMHQALQEGDAQHLDTDPTNPWAIENIHLLSDYLHCIKDEDERRMLDRIISRFQQIREEKFHRLQRGIIHGDFHDYNLIVDWESADIRSSSPSSERSSSLASPLQDTQHRAILQKYGIIDFEEMSMSYPALELSRLIADMMIGCHLVNLTDIGGHVLAGYVSVDCTPVKQFGFCLYDTALACLVQYIVLSTVEYQEQEEPNEYCLLSTEDSRDVLRKLKDIELAEVYVAWGDVLTSYGLENMYSR